MSAVSDTGDFHALCAYTLSHPDPVFLHQYVVDTHCIQSATAETKGIAMSFALLGLYLAVEKNISGKQVQRFHMQMAKVRKPWPRFTPPPVPASITASDVMAAPPGAQRDKMILAWAKAVWNSCSPEVHAQIRALARSELGIQA
jgi:hypothetical protein